MKYMETSPNIRTRTGSRGIVLYMPHLFNFFNNPWNKHCGQNKKEIKVSNLPVVTANTLCWGFKSSNLNLSNSRTRALYLTYLPPRRKSTSFGVWFGLCCLPDLCSWISCSGPSFCYVFKKQGLMIIPTLKDDRED